MWISTWGSVKMDRPDIKYQQTNIDDSNDDYDDSNEENEEQSIETTPMMDDQVEDLGYEVEDPDITSGGQEDLEESPVPVDDVADIPEDTTGVDDNQEDEDEEHENADENAEEQSGTSGGASGEGEGARESPQVQDERQQEGDGEALSVAMTPGYPQEPPPPYGEPPSYDEAVRVRPIRTTKSYIEAIEGGDGDLEWDRDERVEPSVLQDTVREGGDRTDGIQLEQVVLADEPLPGFVDVELGTVEPSVADTSFSTPATGESRHPPHPPDFEISSSSGIPAIKFSDISRRSWAIYIVSFLVAIGALLMVILLPLSFSYIEYYQYGMRKGRISEVVEYAKEIYDMGRYAIGPGKTFKRYPAWAQFVDYDRMGFFTTDRIILEAQISFQYFIKQDELGLIEQKYDKSYQDTIKSVADAAIKNKAATYSTEEYFSNRGKVEQGFHDALRLKLGGNCCPSRDECIRLQSCHLCSKNQDTCNKGYHVDVKYFQMKQLFIPSELTQKQLNVQVILEGNEEAVHRQNYQVFVKKTEAMTENILNEANELADNGTTQARLTLKDGNTTANAIREAAHRQGLKLLYNVLDIDDDEHKASVHWLRTLERHQRLITGISFKEYIALMQGEHDDD